MTNIYIGSKFSELTEDQKILRYMDSQNGFAFGGCIPRITYDEWCEERMKEEKPDDNG